jgi:hypothetical protein
MLPIIQLVALQKIQVATFRKVHPSKKTAVDFEIAVSNNDANLFSTDDSNNQGVSAKINTKQRYYFQKNGLPMPSQLSIYQKNLESVERLYTIEFDRDWNQTTAESKFTGFWFNFNLGPQQNRITWDTKISI